MAKGKWFPIVILLLLYSHVDSAPLNNQQFCMRGSAILADSIAEKIELPGNSLMLLPVEGKFNSEISTKLLQKLDARGVTCYLEEKLAKNDSINPNLKVSVEETSLTLRGIMQGMLRKGKVERSFAISGQAQLTNTGGQWLQSLTFPGIALIDTLSFTEARAAAGSEGFYAPLLPPTLYERMVEPGVILGITGALVYVFFAAR